MGDNKKTNFLKNFIHLLKGNISLNILFALERGKREIMENDPLNQNSFDVSSWENLFKYAIEKGRINEFKEKFNWFVHVSNTFCMKELNEYAWQRRADFAKEDLREQVKASQRAKKSAEARRYGGK